MNTTTLYFWLLDENGHRGPRHAYNNAQAAADGLALRFGRTTRCMSGPDQLAELRSFAASLTRHTEAITFCWVESICGLCGCDALVAHSDSCPYVESAVQS